MLASSIKMVAAVSIAASVLAFSPSAQAAGYGETRSAAGRGHMPGFEQSFGAGWRGDRGYRHDRRHYRRGVCQPREAVYKALRLGMRRPGVERISPRAIVVVGWNRGHRAKMIFARYTPFCRILDTRGI